MQRVVVSHEDLECELREIAALAPGRSEVRQSGLQLYSPFVELPQPEPFLVRGYLEASYDSINVQHNDWRVSAWRA
jgi:hypothetical protein